MSIPFTQYLRPDGRKRPMTINRPEHIEGMALALSTEGARFNCEELSTGHVSVTCEFAGGDVAIEVCPNGPPVEEAVDRMIKAAYKYITCLEPHEAPDA